MSNDELKKSIYNNKKNELKQNSGSEIRITCRKIDTRK